MSEFVKPEYVFINKELNTRESVLEFLSQKAFEFGFAEDVESVRKAFLYREEEGMTGLEGGFAIPHAKDDVISMPGVFILKLSKGVEWPSFDDKPVDTVLALLVPGDKAGTTHLRILSKVAVMLMDDDFKKFLKETNDESAIADEINARL